MKWSPAKSMPFVALLALLASLQGCASPGPTLAEQAAELYPVGSRRSEIVTQHGEPQHTVDLPLPPDQSTASRPSYEHQMVGYVHEVAAKPPAKMLVYTVLRGSLGTTFGATPGLYEDYVFLDAADTVVYAHRRHLD